MIDFFLHLDQHVFALIREYGAGVYGILFAIIFCETGLVIAPFLPGDSLLFAVGIFCHGSGEHNLNYWLVFFILAGAAFLGDNLNYQVGRIFGEKLFRRESSRFFKRSYIERTQHFFEKHGGKTLILARFVPIVRTFAPFVAGMGKMEFHRFLAYSASGATLWVGLCLTAGYWFGRIPWVKENFSVAMLGVVVVSVIPVLFKVRAARRDARSRNEAKRLAETNLDAEPEA